MKPSGNANEKYFGGIIDGNVSNQYISAVYFSASITAGVFQKLLRIKYTDAAHNTWGDCTLYSFNGVLSDMSCFNIAHALILGNEDKAGWKKFMQFIKDLYPTLASDLYQDVWLAYRAERGVF